MRPDDPPHRPLPFRARVAIFILGWLLILGGVAVAVGGWFLAHRHGALRGVVSASRQQSSNAVLQKNTQSN
jgi:hypothetical protein